MTLLLDAIFASVALSHLFVDILNGQRAVLLTYVSTQLGLSNTDLGLASTIYVMSAALVQPVFGYLSDRIGSRWVVAGGVLWMAIFFSLGLVIPGNASLWLLVIASAGSGAFHPAGGMQATLRGRTLLQGFETTAASYFFVFGQLGFFFGPILAGPILDHAGQTGLLIMVLPAFFMSFYAARHIPSPKKAVEHPVTAEILPAPALQPYPATAVLPGVPVPQAVPFRATQVGNLQDSSPVRDRQTSASPSARSTKTVIALACFVILAAAQSWAQQNMTTFVPKYLADMGQSASMYGFVSALFMGGTALGNILGGGLADRYGKRLIAITSLFLSAIPFYFIPSIGLSPLLFILVPLSGLLIGATQSIIVVHGQNLMPYGMALATGLVLGLTFSSGALGSLVAGRMADVSGFGQVFQLNALLVIVAAAMSWVLAGKPKHGSR